MMRARTLVLTMSLVTSVLVLGSIGQVASPAGQLPVAPADDRLAKLPSALREQGRMILAEPDEDRRADLVEELAETDALGALDFLLALLDSDSSADVREDIVDELGEVSDPRVGPALERRVSADPDLEIALASLEVLRARAAGAATEAARAAARRPANDRERRNNRPTHSRTGTLDDGRPRRAAPDLPSDAAAGFCRRAAGPTGARARVRRLRRRQRRRSGRWPRRCCGITGNIRSTSP